jgi:putative solute:sodium symporter small subunit
MLTPTVDVLDFKRYNVKISFLTEQDTTVYDAASRDQACLLRGSIAAFTRREGAMAELSEQQRQAYWHYNVRLTIVLLVIWFVTAYIVSGLAAGWLNRFTFLGFPLGYYMAAQGSLAIFVLEIAIYAYLMNKRDRQYGLVEEE